MAEEEQGEHSSKSPADRLTLVIALLSSIATATLTALNLIFFFADRNDRHDQEAFAAQTTIAKSYFDSFSHLRKDEFCDHRDDALLFGQTALTIANIKQSDAILELNAQQVGAAHADRTGVEAVAMLIFGNVWSKSKSQCDNGAVSTPRNAKTQVVNAIPTASANSSTYSLRSMTLQRAAPARPVIWIHFAAGSADAERAEQVRAKLIADGYTVPKVDPVSDVPNQTQVRVYRERDISTGSEIAKDAGLTDAQIVNLQSAYGGLPGNSFEIWLKRSQPLAKPGQLDFSDPKNSALIP